MADIVLIASVNGHHVLSTINNIDIRWIGLELNTRPVKDNALPMEVHEICISTDLGLFWQYNPEPEIRLTFLDRVKRTVRRRR
jgi:hypothetical protein